KKVFHMAGEKIIVLFVIFGIIQREATLFTSTTTLHNYYFYKFYYNYKFTIYYLWPWKSHFGFNYQDIILNR
ncbi:MAG: hypothetical protein CMO44_14545, partial [Verrucomicrobiales bacterium]|nr:hypothetical protein [Verrucomicrobiales bacterium]